MSGINFLIQPRQDVRKNVHGFIDYNDASTAISAVSLVADTWTDMPNDGLGSFTNRNFKPVDVINMMDTTTGYIDPSELKLGDSMLIRNDFTVTPGTNNLLLEFRYSLGTGVGAYTLPQVLGRLDSGAGIGYRFALKPDFIYLGDENTRGNIIKLQLKLSGAGTFVNSGSVIQRLKFTQ